MPGVPRGLAKHTLNVDPKYKPVRQFLRQFNEERRKAIGEEVARLLAAGFIIEVFHPKWLANPVLVLKKNGTWRMCVDYTVTPRDRRSRCLPCFASQRCYLFVCCIHHRIICIASTFRCRHVFIKACTRS